jgi:hypothetical protein
MSPSFFAPNAFFVRAHPAQRDAKKAFGGSMVRITSGFMAKEALAVFGEWAKRRDKKTY